MENIVNGYKTHFTIGIFIQIKIINVIINKRPSRSNISWQYFFHVFLDAMSAFSVDGVLLLLFMLKFVVVIVVVVIAAVVGALVEIFRSTITGDTGTPIATG